MLIQSLADRIGGLDFRAERGNTEVALKAFARFKQTVHEKTDSYEREAERRDQMGLLDVTAPEQWRSQYYIRQGYRLVCDESAMEGHWRGGEPLHKNAVCPHCRKPLLLFYEINCRDSRLRSECPEMFGEIHRLPLYYCCRRPEPTVYQVLDDGSIRMHTPELAACETSPFSQFPDAWPRTPVRLEPIPRDIENLLIIANSFDRDWLKTDECRRIGDYLGVDGGSLYGTAPTRFGGALSTIQGFQERACPNKLCLTHQMGHPVLRNKSHYQMKELAVISDDAGFNMRTSCAQIVFYICWKCHTIEADYQCD